MALRKMFFILAGVVIVVFAIGMVRTFHEEQIFSEPSISESPKRSIADPSRVTKKAFGIYSTPKTSLVENDRFTGWHSGTDFETTIEEADIDVPVMAICEGKLLVKRTTSGYGGVAVQGCNIKGEPVTVVYGHVKLASIAVAIGTELKAGEQFAVLGKGYSTETDGERKHLHLGIHRGMAISILGYVQNQADLKDWIDPETIVK